MWFIRLYNSECPYRILQPEKEYPKCNHPNEMYRPNNCCERVCPIRINEQYTD